ncbi:MAG: DUF3343 domain-containing protein [Syntrophomonas sp.]|nr:DUF3343 domain-containing protein [Syntrophomonas sp.]
MDNLFKSKEYGVFTFISTSQALKAERALKNASANFLIMPTPREISTSCGLAIKVALNDMKSSQAVLSSNLVEVAGVYKVRIADGKTNTERIDNE